MDPAPLNIVQRYELSSYFIVMNLLFVFLEEVINELCGQSRAHVYFILVNFLDETVEIPFAMQVKCFMLGRKGITRVGGHIPI